jgi:hypothetical protein
MGFADLYLAKQSSPLHALPDNICRETDLIIIIPAYNEPGLFTSLGSLLKCTPTSTRTLVLILVNFPDTSGAAEKELNQGIYDMLKKWSFENSGDHIHFHPYLYPDMPKKFAGVGLARKTLMDMAARIFNMLSRPDGIIASFDADALCDPNYFQELITHFKNHPKKDGCVIYFEHPTEGQDFSSDIYRGIILYELHLRYYIESIRYTGFPEAYHTVGSSFAVRADAYCRQGGMNRKKAGEDFYFLQKYFELGTFNELNTSRIIPSPRPSSRVPFGTGAAIGKFEQERHGSMLTYNPAGFEALKSFFELLPEIYSAKIFSPENLPIPIPLRKFLTDVDFPLVISEIIANSSSQAMFQKRFFRWFNLFRIMKFLNSTKNDYPDVDVKTAALDFIHKNKPGLFSQPCSEKELLFYFRRKQRGIEGA